MNSDEHRSVDSWSEMTAWLLDQLSDQPVGLVVELGPKDVRALVTKDGVVVDLDAPYDGDENDSTHDDSGCGEEYEDDERAPAVCFQIHFLSEGVLLVRRSRLMLDILRLDSHDPSGLALNHWFHDDPYGDCTDGYLYTTDLTVAAEACTSWFRDIPGAPPLDEIGLNYEFAVSLPGRGDS